MCMTPGQASGRTTIIILMNNDKIIIIKNNNKRAPTGHLRRKSVSMDAPALLHCPCAGFPEQWCVSITHARTHAHAHAQAARLVWTDLVSDDWFTFIIDSYCRCVWTVLLSIVFSLSRIEAKETYYRGKRDLLWKQKGPMNRTPEHHLFVKSLLFQRCWQRTLARWTASLQTPCRKKGKLSGYGMKCFRSMTNQSIIGS